MTNYINNDKEIFDLQQRHAIESHTCNKIFFSSCIVNIFMFTSSIISIITITLVVYLFYQNKHIRTIVASFILHKIKEVEANSSTNPEINNYECGTLAYVGILLTVLSMIIVIFLHYRKSRLCRGYRFSNIRKIVLFIDVDFSFCCSNCRSWFSLEQNCLFIEDKLSSTTVDFIRSEGIAGRQHLIWGMGSSLSMPRTYRGVKSVA